jgi:hypothetical protein
VVKLSWAGHALQLQSRAAGPADLRICMHVLIAGEGVNELACLGFLGPSDLTYGVARCMATMTSH